MDSRDSRLTGFQRDVLDAFFALESSYFLTGGGALAGFHLGHRETHDLDLFSHSEDVEAGDRLLREAARSLGGTVEEIRTAPDFRRRVVRRGSEAVIVDIVRDRVPPIVAEKPRVGSVRVDPPREIQANKLTALLSRAEIRDLVDVRALDRAGFRVEDSLTDSVRKDAGLTPAQLGWVLSQIEIGDDARIPGGLEISEIRNFLRELIDRLAKIAHPL